MSFFAELKRRNVFRVGIAYLVGAWVLAQVAELLLSNFEAPAMVMKSILVVLIVGFPLALFLAWAYELTPEGVKPEAEVDRSQSITPRTGRKLDRIIMVILVIALSYFAWDKFNPPAADSRAERAPTETELAGGRSRPNEAEDRAQARSYTEKSIAVLPFVNMSSDPEQEYFSDGITEEILNRLARISGLQVAARTSAFSFKGQNEDVREIARQLGVANILEGSVRKSGEQVRITAQLIRASDGFHLWSQSYDRKLENIFAIQDDIASDIAGALEISLGVSDQPAAGVVDPEVYDLYLRARALHRQRGVGELEAIELFQQALAIDPAFAPAWAGLAHSYIVVFNFVSLQDAQSLGNLLEKSQAAAQKALDLDPGLATALHAMGNNLLFRFDWAGAEDYYSQALQLDPDSSDIMEDYATLLLYTLQLEKAEKVIERMVSLDPYVPVFLQKLDWLYAARGEFALRDEVIDRILGINPDLGIIQAEKLMSLLQNEQHEAARAYAGEMNPLNVDPEGVQALIDWMQHPEQALNAAAEQALAFVSFVPMLVGQFEIWIDGVEGAGAQWPEWYMDGVQQLLGPTASPEIMRRFRAEPRSKALLLRVKLPDYWRKVGWPDVCRPIGEEDFECF